jgi:hypothetical protein
MEIELIFEYQFMCEILIMARKTVVEAQESSRENGQCRKVAGPTTHF